MQMSHAPGPRRRFIYATIGALAMGSAVAAGSAADAAPAMRPPAAHARPFTRRFRLTTPIQHVIVIVQENRSVDNLFHGYPTGQSFPGAADTVAQDPVTGAVLQPCSLYELQSGCPTSSNQNTQCDPSHAHEPAKTPEGFSTEYDDGQMDGFSNEYGNKCVLVNGENVAFSYVPPSDVTQYWGFAGSYAFLNHALQSNNGPSFPGHQYLIAGQAGGLLPDGTIDPSNPWSIDENDTTPKHVKGGQSYTSCLTPTAYVTAVNLLSSYPGVESKTTLHPCNGYATIFDEARASGLSWKYYTGGESGLWGGPSAVSQDCMGINSSTGACNNANIVNCSPQALKDFINNASVPLPSLTYVTPSGKWSDHPVAVSPNAQTGPNWVAWLVNTIGKSKYWKTTTIIVTWDDWGGWFDHYQPGGLSPNQSIINCATNGQLVTPASCGFRVPVIVISPYAKPGYVDAGVTNAAGSILLYIEHTFGLSTLAPRGSGALGTADDWTSDDLMGTMNFSGGAQKFVPQPTTTPSGYYTKSSCIDGSTGVE